MIDYESPDAANFIPCLSIRQPYAWLIVNGFKPVENRTWPTRFRGRILIHAGVTYPKGEYADDAESFGSRYGIGYPAREAMIGGIVGSVTITDCVREHPSEWWVGPWGFVMDKPRAFAKIIPHKGALGIFAVPASILEA